MRFILRFRSIGLVALLVCGGLSCTKGPLYAPDGAVLTISTDRSTLRLGDDRALITILGFAKDGEALHNHTRVLLTATLGRLPDEVELMNGRAVVEFFSGNVSGTAQISARSGGIAVTQPLSIVIGAAALNTLTLSLNPSRFPVGGGVAEARAYAFDAAGNLLPGISVMFSSDAGYFSGGNVRSTGSDGSAVHFLHVETSGKVRVECLGKSAEAAVTVEKEVENKLPTADFTFSPTTPKNGETVYFNGGLSSDSDGVIASYVWDFGDGDGGRGERVTHVFRENRTYNVVLRVTDDRGGSDVVSKAVSVSTNQSPSADFDYSPKPARRGQSIVFDGTLSSDPDGSIVKYEWNFGDGQTGSGAKPGHIFTESRTFTVYLRVTDNLGAVTEISKSVVVTD